MDPITTLGALIGRHQIIAAEEYAEALWRSRPRAFVAHAALLISDRIGTIQQQKEYSTRLLQFCQASGPETRRADADTYLSAVTALRDRAGYLSGIGMHGLALSRLGAAIQICDLVDWPAELVPNAPGELKQPMAALFAQIQLKFEAAGRVDKIFPVRHPRDVPPAALATWKSFGPTPSPVSVIQQARVSLACGQRAYGGFS